MEMEKTLAASGVRIQICPDILDELCFTLCISHQYLLSSCRSDIPDTKFKL
jgi:hypothetical protein